jgi:SH3-like domain-containing protein
VSSLNLLDITYGVSGFHPHIHAVVVAKSARGAAHSGARLAQRYEAALLRAGFQVGRDTTDDRRVWDAEGLAAYLTKRWRETRRSLFALLKRGLAGCDCAGELFFQAAEVLSGKRFAVITPSLRGCIDG